MYINNQDKKASNPDMYVFGYPGSGPGSVIILYGTRFFHQQAKKVTLDFYYFVTAFLLFYLGKLADVNVPSDSNRQKKR
jgi:hypothetical protein